MDITTISIIVIGIIGIALLYSMSRNILGVIVVILAILNDLADLGLVSLQGYEWVWDVAVCVLLLLWCRNLGAFIALADMIPPINGVPFNVIPFNVIAVAVSYGLKARKESKKE